MAHLQTGFLLLEHAKKVLVKTSILFSMSNEVLSLYLSFHFPIKIGPSTYKKHESRN